MTVTAPPTRRRRSKRWLRAAIPFIVLFGVWVFTGVIHAIEEPDLDEPGTLSPTGTGGHGSSRLAEMLEARGVRIERVTSSTQALQAVAGNDTTVFVPAPDYLKPTFWAELFETRGAHRVVVVQPGLRAMIFSTLPIYPAGNRWATVQAPPGCGVSYATQAGQAAVLNSRYEVDDESFGGQPWTSFSCYVGGLVGVEDGDMEAIYAGATDPFRNDRIDEVGNAALATSLLSEHGRVVWVDVHGIEPFNTPKIQVALPDYGRGDRDRTNTGFPTIDAFPSWLWATLLLGFVAAVLLAVARARRLGPPVAEPLPVLVPAAEAVTGRGRLYERIGAREASLNALRAAAISRINRVLNPFGSTTSGSSERELATPGPAADALVRRIVERTSAPEHYVRATLYGPPPADDVGLAREVADLDALVSAVVGPQAASPPDQPRGGTP